MTQCGHPHETRCQLCPGCTVALRNRLQRIPELYLLLQLEAVEGTPPPSARAAGGFSSQLPISASQLDLLMPHAGQTGLVGWALNVAEKRKLVWPTVQQITTYGWLLEACTLLGRHWSWVTDQDWAVLLHEETREIERRLRAAIEPNKRWVATRLPCTTEECEGVLWLDRLDERNPVLLCRECDAAPWEPEAWDRLAAEIKAPVTIRDALSFASWIKEDTLRKWIKRGVLPNHGTNGQIRVVLSEVLAAWQRRDTPSVVLDTEAVGSVQ